MNILVDENIPLMTVTDLRKLGHDVKDIRGTDQQGLHDVDLWTLALVEQRMLITTDKGFTERRHDQHSGIMVVRLRQPNRLKIHSAVLLAMGRFNAWQWPGLLVVMRDRTMSVLRRRG